MEIGPAVRARREAACLGVRPGGEQREQRETARADGAAGRQAVLRLALAERVHRLARNADVALRRVQLHALDAEELLLERDLVARVARGPPRGADHAMTGHDDRQRIPAQCLRHRAHRPRLADAPRDARVRGDRPVRDGRRRFEHRALEIAPREPPVERPVEVPATAADVVQQIALQALELRPSRHRLTRRRGDEIEFDRAAGRGFGSHRTFSIIESSWPLRPRRIFLRAWNTCARALSGEQFRLLPIASYSRSWSLRSTNARRCLSGRSSTTRSTRARVSWKRRASSGLAGSTSVRTSLTPA